MISFGKIPNILLFEVNDFILILIIKDIYSWTELLFNHGEAFFHLGLTILLFHLFNDCLQIQHYFLLFLLVFSLHFISASTF